MLILSHILTSKGRESKPIGFFPLTENLKLQQAARFQKREKSKKGNFQSPQKLFFFFAVLFNIINNMYDTLNSRVRLELGQLFKFNSYCLLVLRRFRKKTSLLWKDMQILLVFLYRSRLSPIDIGFCLQLLVVLSFKVILIKVPHDFFSNFSTLYNCCKYVSILYHCCHSNVKNSNNN